MTVATKIKRVKGKECSGGPCNRARIIEKCVRKAVWEIYTCATLCNQLSCFANDVQ